MHNNISIKLNSVEEFLYTLYSNTLGKVLYIVQSTLYESSIVVNVNDFQVNYFSLTIMYIYWIGIVLSSLPANMAFIWNFIIIDSIN